MTLDERKKEILKSIVNEYVNSAEPVSSGVLIEKYPLKLSSATIRNEMSELERLGYLEKPYSSSGRVPSNLGYRYFVDDLINVEESEEEVLDLEDILKIKTTLNKKVTNYEELSKLTSATLSEITHYTTVVVGPSIKEDIIELVQFIKLKNDLIMVLVVTNTGLVKETIIKFEDDISDEILDDLRKIFNKRLVGHPINILTKGIEEYIKEEAKVSAKIITKVINEINKVILENYVHIQNQVNSFMLPELKNDEYMEEYINIIKNSEEFLEYLNEETNEGTISIKIAGENDKIKNFSIITLSPKVEDKEIGKISVLAPKRMNYKKVISAMKHLLKVISNDDKKERGGNNLMKGDSNGK